MSMTDVEQTASIPSTRQSELPIEVEQQSQETTPTTRRGAVIQTGCSRCISNISTKMLACLYWYYSWSRRSWRSTRSDSCSQVRTIVTMAENMCISYSLVDLSILTTSCRFIIYYYSSRIGNIPPFILVPFALHLHCAWDALRLYMEHAVENWERIEANEENSSWSVFLPLSVLLWEYFG